MFLKVASLIVSLFQYKSHVVCVCVDRTVFLQVNGLRAFWREKEGILLFERISVRKGVYQKFITALGQTSEMGNV